MGQHVTFDKLSNTRDIGGMKTLDKRKIISGKLFRSGNLNELSLTDRHRIYKGKNHED